MKTTRGLGQTALRTYLKVAKATNELENHAKKTRAWQQGLDPPAILGEVDAALDCVERFGRRGTEPNELFRSEFGHNSFKIQESVEKFSYVIFM